MVQTKTQVKAQLACAYSRPQGCADFYIDGELCLSEPIERSWNEDGTPKKSIEMKATAKKRAAVTELHDYWQQTGFPHRM